MFLCWFSTNLDLHRGICTRCYCQCWTSHFGHFRIHPFGRRHVGGQKCIAVIERKALNVSLFTNASASDYSNNTCMERSMCLYLTNIVVSLERWWATMQLLPGFLSITDPQHGGGQTDVYGSVRMWQPYGQRTGSQIIPMQIYLHCAMRNRE